MTLVDTNVLLDIATNDATWAAWSIRQLDIAATRGLLLINDVIYAELSLGYTRVEAMEKRVREGGLTIVPIPRPALFLAGKAFRTYRRSGGAKTGVLPDFFIGAHAAVQGLTLLSRDPRRFRSYFPAVRLVCP